MEYNSSIFVAGHNGLVGSALVRRLKMLGYHNIITVDRHRLDLSSQLEVRRFFAIQKPEYVFLSAAKVGGINYNKNYPAEFIYENLIIQSNVINSAYENKAKKLMFLGSACIYPKVTPQPIKEEYLLTDPLEETNEGYAIAKIAGLTMCKKYREQYGFNAISVMPANLYGVNDNFNINECHVIPAMINKFHDAKITGKKKVTLFGDGSPTREFLHVDDLADALVFLMNKYDDPAHINIGSGQEYSIKELAEIVAHVVGWTGEIEWDTSKPNGTPRRKLDTSKLDDLGWSASIDLSRGIDDTYGWFLENNDYL
jgi:GDP-L-fucose synthase